jgi:hypothetical protein
MEVTLRSSKSGKYHVLQRLVSAHPFRRGSHWNSNGDDTSIETTEHWRSFNDDIITSGCVWLSTVDGWVPDASRFVSPAADAHPSDLADQDGNTATLCWAAFPGNKAPSLCVLVHSTAVCLWDVYPDKSLYRRDGWTVSLPFDCCGIHALAIRGVLFNDSGTFGYSQQESHVLNAVDEDDGFLKGAIS